MKGEGLHETIAKAAVGASCVTTECRKHWLLTKSEVLLSDTSQMLLDAQELKRRIQEIDAARSKLDMQRKPPPTDPSDPVYRRAREAQEESLEEIRQMNSIILKSRVDAIRNLQVQRKKCVSSKNKTPFLPLENDSAFNSSHWHRCFQLTLPFAEKPLLQGSEPVSVLTELLKRNALRPCVRQRPRRRKGERHSRDRRKC